MSAESSFVETEALLAVLNEDEDAMEAILREMLPGELATLKHAAQYLADSCRSAIRIKQREVAEPAEDAACDYGYPLGGMHPRTDWCKLPAGHEDLHKGDSHPIGFTNTGTIRRGGTR